MAHMKVVRLLTALDLLPLEECTSDAEEWRQEIRDAVRELQATGLPADDLLRYDSDGNPLTRQELEAVLEAVIEDWPVLASGGG
jgi:hypothetical protein